VIDVVATRERRHHEPEQLVAGVGTAGLRPRVEVLVDQLPEGQMVGQRGRQDEPGIGHQAVVIERHVEAGRVVVGVDPVWWTPESWGLEPPGKGVHMGEPRPRYPTEFRAEAVRLAREPGHTLREVARDLDVSYESLRRWVIQADIDAGQVEGLTSDERAELIRLRRENRTLRTEREILKKAAAFFARETDGTP
jgi:transposase